MRILSASYPPEADDSLIADGITGVQGRSRFDQFDQDDVNFVFGYRQMADATGDNYEFSGADPKLARPALQLGDPWGRKTNHPLSRDGVERTSPSSSPA
jgi:hypothetical protein